MAWHSCATCENVKVIGESEPSKNSSQKTVNYHEESPQRQFRITIHRQCQGTKSDENGLEELENERKEAENIDFFVNLTEIATICPYFEKFEGKNHLKIVTNCSRTRISAPEDVADEFSECPHSFSAPLNPRHFHAFLESACPSLYGIRPVPITMLNIEAVLDILAHFHSEPLLTNCERVLMATNIAALDISLLIRLLEKGLCVSLDHRILGRILCVCLMNSAKIADVSQELTGNVGSVFAQAFVSNVAKNFRHIKPLEQENRLWPEAMRSLMNPVSDEPKTKKRHGKGRKEKECDHSEDAFECILCFDKRCGKCKGEAAFCYKALDNFLYEIRLQLYPHTYRPHLDRDLLREDRVNDYILRHQLQPLPAPPN